MRDMEMTGVPLPEMPTTELSRPLGLHVLLYDTVKTKHVITFWDHNECV